jgi:hypothetical protein
MKGIRFGECPICRQGDVLAVKDISTGELLLMCDDCRSQWKSPKAAKSSEAALTNEVSHVEAASLDDVEAAGWHVP